MSRPARPELAPVASLAASPVEDDRLAATFAIARILVSENDPKEMAAKLLACLIEVMEAADAGVLLLYDRETDSLRVSAALGYDQAILRQLSLKPGESMTGRAYLTGQAELYPTPEATAAAMATMTPANAAIVRAAALGAPPLSAICVPLIARKTKVGVLVLENLRQPSSFSAADLVFLQAVGDLLALAIENARLGEELAAIQAHGEASRFKAELISTLAHEMRTPLTSIKGYSTALLMEEATFAPETQREFLQFIDEECDVLQNLIHDLLESSIIDAGFLTLERQPVILPRLVRGVIEEIAHHSTEHRFRLDFPPDFPILDADPQRVTQVLRNLLDNAVKYSPGGGLVVVRGEVRDGEVVISVADQGEGIAPEHLSHLFEKFFRIKTGQGRHVAGTGLGLPIARAIVESHGGQIWAESQLGCGSTFYFTLPLSPPEADQ